MTWYIKCSTFEYLFYFIYQRQKTPGSGNLDLNKILLFSLFCTQISTMSQLTAMRSRVGHNGFPAPPSGLSAKDNYNQQQQHEITTSSSDEFNPRQIANHDTQFVRSPRQAALSNVVRNGPCVN